MPLIARRGVLTATIMSFLPDRIVGQTRPMTTYTLPGIVRDFEFLADNYAVAVYIPPVDSTPTVSVLESRDGKLRWTRRLSDNLTQPAVKEIVKGRVIVSSAPEGDQSASICFYSIDDGSVIAKSGRLQLSQTSTLGESAVRSLAVCPEAGLTYLCLGPEIIALDWRSGAELYRVKLVDGNNRPASAARMVVADSKYVCALLSSREVAVFNLKLAGRFRSFPGYAGGAIALGGIQSRPAIVLGGLAGVTRTFTDQDGHPLRNPDVEWNDVNALVRLYDIPSGLIVNTFHGTTETVNVVAATSNGSRIVAACTDGRLLIWGGDGSTKSTLVSKNGLTFRSIAFSDNERLVGISTGKIVEVQEL